MTFAGAAQDFGEDVDFYGLLRAVGLRHRGDADENALFDVGHRLAVYRKHFHVIGELHLDRRAVTSFHVQCLTVDALDRAAHAHHVGVLRRRKRSNQKHANDGCRRNHS